jgi:hypothetical protein
MFRELCFLLEAFSTIRASERLVARVDSQVILQITALIKFSGANAAYQD